MLSFLFTLVLLQAPADARPAARDAAPTTNPAAAPSATVHASAQGATTAAPSATQPAKPNFVFVLGEGLGWSSTSVDFDGREPSHAKPAGLTPNLARLAEGGLRFSDFYATAPRCTPSRASFFTGISPAKLHMTYVNEGGANRRERDDPAEIAARRVLPPSPSSELPSGVKTTGDVLRAAGYATAHFGKWHVGRTDPTKHGFDVSDGANTNQGPERGETPNPKQFGAITDRAIEFMRAQVQAKKPFFVQVSHYSAANEDEVTPESLEFAKKLLPDARGKTLATAAGTRDLDLAIGRVLAALKELGVDGNTYVFFSTDHGTPGGGGGGREGGERRAGANPPFVGGKGSVREGGVRVPFLVAGPGVQAGSVSSVRASGMDLLPTLLELAGAPLAKPEKPDDALVVEGGSLANVLKHAGAGAVERSHAELVLHFPHYDLDNGGPATAIYSGAWKLMRNYETGRVTLHDLAKDREEAHDVAEKEQEVVKDLTARMDAYLKAVNAQMPTPNDGTAPKGGENEPRKEKGGGKKGGGKKGEGIERGEQELHEVEHDD